MNKKKQITYSLIAISISFLLIETAAHFILSYTGDNKTMAMTDPYMGYRLRPGYKDPKGFYNVNSLGFRGWEFNKEKGLDERRIICLGGSTTFGDSSSPAMTYPNILKRMINERLELNYEVINAGVPGYTTLQLKRYLISELFDYKPDILVVAVGWNDIIQSFRKKWTPQDTLNQESKFSFLGKAAVYRLMKKIIFKKKVIEIDKGVSDPRALLFFEKNLMEIAEKAKENNIRLILMEEPIAVSHKDFQKPDMVTTFFKAYEKKEIKLRIETFQQYSEVMKKTASANNLPFIDSGLSLKCHDKKEFFHDLLHPTNEGNAIVAFNLVTELFKNSVPGVNNYNDRLSALDKYVLFQNFYEFSKKNKSQNKYFVYYRTFYLRLSNGKFGSNLPKSLPFWLNSLAVHYHNTGMENKTVEVLEKAQELYHDFPLTYYNLGKLLENNKGAQGIPFFTKTLELAPNFQLALRELKARQAASGAKKEEVP